MITSLKKKLKWMEEYNLFIQEKLDSLVLWNCGHPSNKKITLDLVNDPNTTGKYPPF